MEPALVPPRSPGFNVRTSFQYEVEVPVTRSLNPNDIDLLLNEMEALCELVQLGAKFKVLHKDLFKTITSMGHKLFAEENDTTVFTKIQLNAITEEDTCDDRDVMFAVELAAGMWKAAVCAPDCFTPKVKKMKIPINEQCATYAQEGNTRVVRLFDRALQFETPPSSPTNVPVRPKKKRPLNSPCQVATRSQRKLFH